MIGDIICTIIVVLIVSAMIIIAFAMCKAASRYDQISEEQYRQYFGEGGNNEKEVQNRD